jgi:hypothetical protein
LSGTNFTKWNVYKLSARDYLLFIERLHPLLRKLAGELQDNELVRRVDALKRLHEDPARIQCLHRQVLLQIQSHIRRKLPRP